MSSRSAKEMGCYGRQRELRSLTSRLHSGLQGIPGSTLVVGRPGFGRSTFLDQMANPKARSVALGPLADKLEFCAVRLSTAKGLDERRFLGMMRRALDGVQVERLDAPCTEAELEAALQKAIERRGRAHVFLIDDFHLISQSPAFSAPFFSFLRYLGYNLRASYVLTSQLEIGEMAIRQDVQASPFWNIFSKIRLGPLRSEHGLEALSGGLSGVQGIGEEHVRALLPLTDGIPFLIAAVAEAVVGEAEASKPWHSRSVLDQALARARPILDQVWDAINDPSKEALISVLDGDREPSAGERDALLALVDGGYLDGNTLQPRGLVLRWDWTRRLGGDVEPLAAELRPLPELRSSLIQRFLGR